MEGAFTYVIAAYSITFCIFLGFVLYSLWELRDLKIKLALFAESSYRKKDSAH